MKTNFPNAMSTRIITRLFLFVLVFVSASCKDPLFDGKYETHLRVYNKTNAPIVVEYEDEYHDTVAVVHIQPKVDGACLLGIYEGNTNESKPSDEFVNEKLSHISIYWTIGDSTLQYLPRTYYDEAGKLNSYVSPEFVIYEIYYELTVTEEVFSDKVVKE